jgi:dolichol-phosphate mannosyltransferase
MMRAGTPDSPCIPSEAAANSLASNRSQPAAAQLKLALVIPTLCEAKNIGGLLVHVSSVLNPLRIPYEILVVDDDSSDGTGDAVLAIASDNPHVRLIVRKGERGLAGAVIDGWRQSDGDVFGVMDADLQHPPEMLTQLYAAIQDGCDLAIGSRYAQGGKTEKWHPVRKLLSTVAVWAAWPLQRARLRVKDPMAGFFMVRKHCVDHLQPQRTGFRLLLDTLVRGHIDSVREIPIAFGLRSRGASKANFRIGWDYAKLLVKLYAWRCGFRRWG